MKRKKPYPPTKILSVIYRNTNLEEHIDNAGASKYLTRPRWTAIKHSPVLSACEHFSSTSKFLPTFLIWKTLTDEIRSPYCRPLLDLESLVLPRLYPPNLTCPWNVIFIRLGGRKGLGLTQSTNNQWTSLRHCRSSWRDWSRQILPIIYSEST